MDSFDTGVISISSMTANAPYQPFLSNCEAGASGFVLMVQATTITWKNVTRMHMYK